MERKQYIERISKYFKSHQIVGLLGPRQCGKTTLARKYANIQNSANRENYFDLEDARDYERLQKPQLVLEKLEGLVIIDEIQLMPSLFATLRVLVDREDSKARFLILGSASRELINKSAETLAGRIAYIELPPFSYLETHNLDKLWLRGGFPRSYLAPNIEESNDWREFYITTFLEQDIPNLGIQIPAVSLRRFWTMLAHYHGNIFNASEFGRSFGSADTTIRKYLDILTGTFMVRQLQPWQENIKKRQVKAPKIYFRDSGLLHTLLNIFSEYDLQTNPKLGASWEGFALEEVVRVRQVKPHHCYFWATHTGAEIDLLIFEGNNKKGFEFKYTDAPKMTKSMRINSADLALDEMTVIYPGAVDYQLDDKIYVKGLKQYLEENSTLNLHA